MEFSSGSSFLGRERKAIEDALREIAAEQSGSLRPPLREPVEYALSTTGKRLRPILTVLAFQAARGVDTAPAAAYRLACALEIVHTYSLVHDDLPCMDDDNVRRGRPTVHRVFGVPHAILAGAVLLPMAMSVLCAEAAALGLDDRTQGALVRELAQAAGAAGMVGGQLMDLEAEQQPIDGASLESIHRLKTGALLTASLRIGAIAGGADERLLASLTAYGEALGLAFQIADDLLDVEGDSEALGKTAGRDEALLKASYPSLYGIADARAMAHDRVAEAKGAIAGLGLDHLERVADYVIERRK